MKRFCSVILCSFVLAGCGSGSDGVGTNSGGSGPALTTPQATLDSALSCPTSFTDTYDPVLLVHGTGANGSTWNSGYLPQLSALGYDVCTITLPGDAWDDIQISSEYVVNAVRTMSMRSGRRVTMIGHSQGILEMRWAMKWWPDVRALVSNFISLAGDNHGAPLGEQLCSVGICRAAAWQQSPVSQFLAALNNDAGALGNPPYPPYTSIYSDTDTVAVPPTSILAGATNIAVQQLCPGRQVSHPGMIYDAVAFALVVDALSHDGTADPQRIDPAICKQEYLPGLTSSQVSQEELTGGALFLSSDLLGMQLTQEPALKSYTTAE